MAFVETKDGTKLFYRDWGNGDPVVLVASQALPGDIWNYNVPFFVDRGMRCITFDRRGHGRSDAPGGGYDIDTLASDLGSVLAQLELHDATLVGHSLGGAEVIRYLGRHGGEERVRGAVLVAPTSPRMSPEGDRTLAEAAAQEWKRDLSGWIAANKRAFFTPQTSDALVDWAARLMEAIPLYVQLQAWNTTSTMDLTGDLRAITVPTLVIHGDLDQSVPLRLGQATADLVRGARFKRYADAAHGVFITHRDAVHRDILELIDDSRKARR